jgi:signal transduction histidine kinase
VLIGVYALVVVLLASLVAVTVRGALHGNRRAMALLVPLFLSILPGIGIVALSRVLGRDFGAAGDHVLEITLATEAVLFSLALAYRIRLAEQERAAAQEDLIGLMANTERRVLTALDEERSRIAEDLHETAGQGLVTVANRLSRVGRAPSMPEELRQEIDTVASVSKQVVGDIRRISHDLHAVALQQLGISRAIEALADRFRDATSMRITIDGQIADDALTEDQARHVYRIVQELLVNAVKHSTGREIRLTVRDGDAEISVAMDFDGQAPFDIAGEIAAQRTGTQGGIGLELIAQRIRVLGGRIAGGQAGHNRFEFRFPTADAFTGTGM